jgi:hypothetical protein
MSAASGGEKVVGDGVGVTNLLPATYAGAVTGIAIGVNVGDGVGSGTGNVIVTAIGVAVASRAAACSGAGAGVGTAAEDRGFIVLRIAGMVSNGLGLLVTFDTWNIFSIDKDKGKA